MKQKHFLDDNDDFPSSFESLITNIQKDSSQSECSNDYSETDQITESEPYVSQTFFQLDASLCTNSPKITETKNEYSKEPSTQEIGYLETDIPYLSPYQKTNSTESNSTTEHSESSKTSTSGSVSEHLSNKNTGNTYSSSYYSSNNHISMVISMISSN